MLAGFYRLLDAGGRAGGCSTGAKRGLAPLEWMGKNAILVFCAHPTLSVLAGSFCWARKKGFLTSAFERNVLT